MAGETVNFQAPLQRFSELLQLNMATICQRLAVEIMTGIVRRTPVDTGRARANWNLAIGSPNLATKESESYQPAVPDMSTVASIDGTQQIWITNNLDYIEFLEFGSSKQAPAGMVRVSVAEAEARISLIVQLLDK